MRGIFILDEQHHIIKKSTGLSLNYSKPSVVHAQISQSFTSSCTFPVTELYMT